jgi:hypothetical protein
LSSDGTCRDSYVLTKVVQGVIHNVVCVMRVMMMTI